MSETNFVKVPKESNNYAHLIGILEKEFEFSHCSANKEKFYQSRLRVQRLSGQVDFIPLVLREKTLQKYSQKLLPGETFEIKGHVRTDNWLGADGKFHLKMYVLVNIIKQAEAEIASNYIFLTGNICKEPVLRTTPIGRRITDFPLAVSRKSGASSYIPCIAWGKLAFDIAKLQVGDTVRLEGRFQSRDYLKRFSPTLADGEWKTTYEISVMKILGEEE